jgi:surface protein
MFRSATSFNQPIGNWNVSSVTAMYRMFNEATKFNQAIGNWDVSKVTDMHWMFRGATKFNRPVSNWDVSKVTDMSLMFSGAISFNQDLCAWYNNLQITTSFYDMFSNSNCTDAANPDYSTKKSFCQACTCSGGK